MKSLQESLFESLFDKDLVSKDVSAYIKYPEDVETFFVQPLAKEFGLKIYKEKPIGVNLRKLICVNHTAGSVQWFKDRMNIEIYWKPEDYTHTFFNLWMSFIKRHDYEYDTYHLAQYGITDYTNCCYVLAGEKDIIKKDKFLYSFLNLNNGELMLTHHTLPKLLKYFANLTSAFFNLLDSDITTSRNCLNGDHGTKENRLRKKLSQLHKIAPIKESIFDDNVKSDLPYERLMKQFEKKVDFDDIHKQYEQYKKKGTR